MNLYGRHQYAAPGTLPLADPPEPEPVPEPVPNPPGVKGYVVAIITGKTNLTHSSLMDRNTAEKEAALYRKADRGARYVVCEVREAPS